MRITPSSMIPAAFVMDVARQSFPPEPATHPLPQSRAVLPRTCVLYNPTLHFIGGVAGPQILASADAAHTEVRDTTATLCSRRAADSVPRRLRKRNAPRQSHRLDVVRSRPFWLTFLHRPLARTHDQIALGETEMDRFASRSSRKAAQMSRPILIDA